MGIQRLIDRVDSISRGSKDDSDMILSKEKTVALHVREQDEVSDTTPEEASNICKFICPHILDDE